MKKIVLVCLLITGAFIAKAQNNTAEESQAIAMLRTFYTTYLTGMSAGPGAFSSKKTLAVQRKYCTAHLLNNIKKRNDPDKSDWLDYDPFINAQDSDLAWIKTLTFKRNPAEPDLYTISYYYYLDKKKETTTINLFVTRQNGVLKISSIYLGSDRSDRI